MQNSNEYPRLQEVTDYLDEVLQCGEFCGIDAALNGLQVGQASRQVRKVTAAVDASLESFERSAEADLLLVHHGIFWGPCYPVIGSAYERFATLINQQLALYAAHLPLDAHWQYGNNIHLAESLQLQNMEPFGSYKGRTLGCAGELASPATMDEICTRLGLGEEALQLDFGCRDIRRIAIVSGGGAMAMEEAAKYDLFITGEIMHQHYHLAKELRLSILAMGHYRSETGGVLRLLGLLREKWPAISTEFIDLPTGL